MAAYFLRSGSAPLYLGRVRMDLYCFCPAQFGCCFCSFSSFWGTGRLVLSVYNLHQPSLPSSWTSHTWSHFFTRWKKPFQFQLLPSCSFEFLSIMGWGVGVSQGSRCPVASFYVALHRSWYQICLFGSLSPPTCMFWGSWGYFHTKFCYRCLPRFFNTSCSPCMCVVLAIGSREWVGCEIKKLHHCSAILPESVGIVAL